MAQQIDQTITLHGREYRVSSPFDPQYTEKLARYCDSLMKNIGNATTSTDYLRLSVLTLLQVSHDYFQLLENSKAPSPETEAEISRLITMLDDAEKEVAAINGQNQAAEK